MIVFQPVWPFWVLGVVFIPLLFAVAVIWGVRWGKPGGKVLWGLRFLTVLLLGVLLARPGIQMLQETETYTKNYDVYFVLDTTASMVAEDWETGETATRLDAAKNDIVNLVKEYPDARYSLINVTSSATISIPLTKDSVAVVNGVDFLKPEPTRYSQGSDFSVAASKLNELLKQNEKTSPNRDVLMFLFTDGEVTATSPLEDVEGENLTRFGDIEKYVTAGGVLGYGTPTGGKMKTQNGYIISNDNSYIQDPETGADAISKIDENNLKKYADSLGIEYVHRTSGTDYTPPGADGQLINNGKTAMLSIVDYSWLVAVVLAGLVAFQGGLMLREHRRFTGQVKGGRL